MRQNETPQFNQLIDTYFETLERVSISEAAPFISLFQSLGIPYRERLPHLALRDMRAHIGGIELFSRTSMDGEQIVSMYDPDSEVPILSTEAWYSDQFDPMVYARTTVDTSAPFFEQWKSFNSAVPRPAIEHDARSENSSWNNYDLSFKDCYATYGGVSCEQVLYADMCIETKHSIDVLDLTQCEWCYDCVSCFQCHNAYMSQYCVNSFDIYFCYDVIDCSDCFGCYNIKQKNYCFFNEQLTKEEYERRLAHIDLRDSDVVEKYKRIAADVWQDAYYEAEVLVRTEESHGYDVIDSKQAFGISIFQSERLYNGYDVSYIKDSVHITTCNQLERSAWCIACTDGYENAMSISCHECSNIEYCEMCTACEYCFGCIGLTRKSYCIFNTQYTKEEYFKIVDELKVQMMKDGTYGTFFPYSTSQIAYNISHASVFFPLTRDQVEKIAGRWYSVNRSESVPADVKDSREVRAFDVQLSDPVWDSTSRRLFYYVQPELQLHKTMNIALPRHHPNERRKERYLKIHGLALHQSNCDLCNARVYSRLGTTNTQKQLCSICHIKMLQEDTQIIS